MSFEKFKLRAYITVLARDEYDNDKDFSFLVYNIGLFGNGEIGFTDEDLDAAIERTDFSEIEKENIKEDLDIYKNEFDYYNYWAESIEQCTGQKDKKGNLVYANDLIKAKGFTEPLVVKQNKNGLWETYNGEIKCLTLEQVITLLDCEVIGNIYETKEKK